MPGSTAPADTFLGLTANGWTAAATIFLGLITLLLVAVGWLQLRSIREENTRSRTLTKCDQYDTDPVLDAALTRIFGSKQGGGLTFNDRVSVATVLNYLDSLAIGVQQGLYIEDLARDHMAPILRAHVLEYLDPPLARELKINRDNYATLIALNEAWSRKATYYGGKRGRRFSRRPSEER